MLYFRQGVAWARKTSAYHPPPSPSRAFIYLFTGPSFIASILCRFPTFFFSFLLSLFVVCFCFRRLSQRTRGVARRIGNAALSTLPSDRSSTECPVFVLFWLSVAVQATDTAVGVSYIPPSPHKGFVPTCRCFSRWGFGSLSRAAGIGEARGGRGVSVARAVERFGYLIPVLVVDCYVLVYRGVCAWFQPKRKFAFFMIVRWISCENV